MLRLLFRALFMRSSTKSQDNAPPKETSFRSERRSQPVIRSRPTPSKRIQSDGTAASLQTLETTLTGKCYVVDGDTIRIGKINLRLAGIDAPELEHPWGKKAKWELVQLCKGQVITAEIEPEISYDRLVATCFLPDGRDLSAEMVKRGMALDWPKFSGGKYSHLEPDGIRKKHWKAAARQRGHMAVFNK